MTTWNYSFHRFDDLDSFLTTALQAGAFYVLDDLYFPENVVVDQIGTLTTPAVLDEDGLEIEPPQLLPGYHVNCAWRGDIHPAFATSQVFPQTPRRQWAA